MKVLLLGSKGQVGSSLLKSAPKEWEFTSWSREQFDLSNLDLVEKHFSRLQNIDLVINAAAYTQVDLAETQLDLANELNFKLPELLAKECAKRNIPLVHYSTDYVYPGSGEHFRVEDEAIGPLNAYGVSKARGDAAIKASGCKHLILRTSWVYAEAGKNFVLTMLRLGAEREVLSVVNDQSGSPTFARDIAELSIEAIQKSIKASTFPSGVYHLSNSGTCSWFDFSCEIFKQARELGLMLKVQSVNPIESSAYPQPAKRPKNSRLSLAKLDRTFSLKPRDWKLALQDCLQLAIRENRK